MAPLGPHCVQRESPERTAGEFEDPVGRSWLSAAASARSFGLSRLDAQVSVRGREIARLISGSYSLECLLSQAAAASLVLFAGLSARLYKHCGKRRLRHGSWNRFRVDKCLRTATHRVMSTRLDICHGAIPFPRDDAFRLAARR